MHAARAQASPGRCPGATSSRPQAPRGSKLVARASKRACGGVRRVVGRGVGLQTPPALATSCTERQSTQRGARKIEASVTLHSAQWRRPSSSGRAGVGRALPARCCALPPMRRCRALRPPSHGHCPPDPAPPCSHPLRHSWRGHRRQRGGRSGEQLPCKQSGVERRMQSGLERRMQPAGAAGPRSEPRCLSLYSALADIHSNAPSYITESPRPRSAARQRSCTPT